MPRSPRWSPAATPDGGLALPPAAPMPPLQLSQENTQITETSSGIPKKGQASAARVKPKASGSSGRCQQLLKEQNTPGTHGNRFIMAGEPDVLGRGHHDVGDDAAFEAAHPVREHLAGHPAEG